MVDPLGYMDFHSLMSKSKLILTDSGNIQEESITIKKPCITLRHTSARWETILLKANILFPPIGKTTWTKLKKNAHHKKTQILMMTM